ncbi:tail tube [Enterobacter phage vB_EhoM-IME523]|uniref:Tail completion and sheath stabilizer protein n=3 Tax=Kanagawavirus TaxID=2843399 RepID=A0A6B9XZL3_9CAUD|nr:tail completion and sheath stabilizer protein [Enterobacter phage vB_EclM_CIP9]YP_010650125.1 tail tube [Kosakonia phage 305]YP_010650409.1 tail tube [Enterobacter phage vB_EhoM-IME523]YP_010650709.1 tail tube [Enterobacter phage vB_EclM_Q7622]QEA10637.1 tail tube protein [Enterobacter phage vB_EhoM-IME523]QHS01805.1 tail completion and sheath stabilizer protein [Enterobacter phage vB_EclM_CIP9]QYN80319.1 tail completion protein [Kosakonia phage 305]UIS65684.1 tail completion and sheath s
MSGQNGGLFNQTNVTNFILEVSDNGLTESFKLNCQAATLPGIHIPVGDLPGGTQGISRAKLPGSTIEFDPLMVNFLVDRELSGWLEIYKWMLSLNNYMTHESEAWHASGQPSAVTVHILDNSKQNIVMSIHYYGAWPSDLSEIEFNYREDSDPAVPCMATFNFKSFAVEIDGNIVLGRPQIDDAGQGRLEGRKMAMHPSMR